MRESIEKRAQASKERKMTMLDTTNADKIKGLSKEEAGHITNRKIHLERLVDGGSVPKDMKVQGVDVIDPKLSRVHHQAALGPEIDALQRDGKQACVIVFAPKVPVRPHDITDNFHQVSNPHRYAVVDAAQADRLLGNAPENQGLRDSLQRRTAALTHA